MTSKRQQEIIDNIEGTLANKKNVNEVCRATLTKILENVKNGTHVVAKKRGRSPKPKKA
jgi:hypothetical protein